LQKGGGGETDYQKKKAQTPTGLLVSEEGVWRIPIGKRFSCLTARPLQTKRGKGALRIAVQRSQRLVPQSEGQDGGTHSERGENPQRSRIRTAGSIRLEKKDQVTIDVVRKEGGRKQTAPFVEQLARSSRRGPQGRGRLTEKAPNNVGESHEDSEGGGSPSFPLASKLAIAVKW